MHALLALSVLATTTVGSDQICDSIDRIAIARRLYQLGDTQEAGKLLGSVLDDFSPISDLHLYRALVWAHDHGLDARAREEFERALAIDPASIAAHRHYAQALLDAGELPAALRQLDAIVDKLPADRDQPAAISDDVADAIWLRGEVARKQGHLPEAVQWFERHTRVRPQGDGYHSLGMLFVGLDDDRRARVAFEHDLERDPDCEEARANLAAILHDQGELPGAIGHYRKALSYHPGDALMLRGLARAYAEAGDLELAVGTYRMAVDAAPQDAEARAGLRWARRRLHFWIALPWGLPPLLLLLATLGWLGYRWLRRRRRQGVAT